ncbi:MAG: DUF3307 domain-containing protein [Candidatus Desantisbacteria bacterium]
MADLLLRAFLAHIVGDILLQPDFLSKKKRRERLFILLHGAILFTFFLFFGWGVFSWQWVIFCLLVTGFHILVDWTRIRIGREGIIVGIIDQSLHLGSIVLFAYILFQLI